MDPGEAPASSKEPSVDLAPVISELQKKHQMNLQNLTLTTQPFRTLQLFILATLQYLRRSLVCIITRGGVLLFLIIPLLAIGLLFTNDYDPQGKHIQELTRYAKFMLWWVALGIASSIGLGSGLHTFVLYLGPHIAFFTIKATQCGRVDLKSAPYDTIQFKSGPSWLEKHCSDFGAPVYPSLPGSRVRVSMSSILPHVQLEAFLWGLGTALGELPPFFISRAARSSENKVETLAELDPASSENGIFSSYLKPIKHWLLSQFRHLSEFNFTFEESLLFGLFNLLLAEAMESYQAVPATFGSAAAAAAPNGAGPKPIAGPVLESTNSFSDEFNPEDFIGFLEVFVHQARDIHNICIYHKQDVFARLCLTNNPDVTVSTQTINGGGRNPVFNQNLRLNVKNINCSMKCEIWMLSKAKNYLEDQLLGFALVPLSNVLMANGKLVKEYSLSSTDLFHSPAGFVQLSISYVGASPEVMTIPSLPKSLIVDTTLPDAEPDNSIPCDYEKIEFPDLKADKENQLMVSEYYGIPCADMETQSSDSFVTAENDNCAGEEAGMRIVESFSTANSHDSIGNLKRDTAASSFSTTESTVVLPASSDPLSSTASPRPNVKSLESMEAEVDSSRAPSDDAFFKPIIKIDVPEQPVVQQDFVDMYMKSMQQFTESLAKLKLPMDIDNSSTASENGNSGPTQENGSSGSEKTLPTPKSNGSRVFYGSRAFF